MKIKQKFILFFTLFIVFITSVLGFVSYYFLKSEIELFTQAPNKEFAAIMANELLFKSVISFITILIVITIISIFIGLVFFRTITNSYINNVEKITGLASDRIQDRGSKTEIELLEKYIEIAIDDEKKLKDFEKINSWKEGARLLIHEVKNPLTPLKLSLENMLIRDSKEFEDDLIPAIASTKDIENILNNFKSLVNINYEPLRSIDFVDFFDEFKSQIKLTYPDFQIFSDIKSSKVLINSEPNLLKILLLNLFNNAMEANKEGIDISFTEDKDKLILKFTTLNNIIENIDRCFVLGYSNKGRDRGYGLFLCKMISDYLGIVLEAKNIDNNVIFSVTIDKE